MKRLLAKSYNFQEFPEKPPDFALLTQHSRDVAEACQALSDCIGILCLRNAAVTQFTGSDLLLALKTNGWLQDLGKSNSHFQTMLRNPGFVQLLRHEVISGLLAWNEPLRFCLSEISQPLLLSAIWGAMGHHRKFECGVKPNNVENLQVFTTHADFIQILSDMKNDLSLSSKACFSRDLIVGARTRNGTDLAAGKALRDLQDDFEKEADSIGPELRKFVALIKALGIAADVVASAVARGKNAKNYSVAKYIEQSIEGTGLTEEQLDDLISKRIQSQLGGKIEVKKVLAQSEGFTFRPFQLDVGNSNSSLTLANAGCGSGKSLAAYLWARKKCSEAMSEGRTNFRMIFCLPTTGTTTEHFRDYALESGIDASLTHSRSSVDLKTISETSAQEEAPDGSSPAIAAKAALRSAMDKIDSLALWSTPLTVTTVDTVLGLMANARRSICSFPAIMTAAIVFDEVHAFDENMFGHLLLFLKNFPAVPVLLMTASLPEDRKRALMVIREDLRIITGPADFEMLPRYQLEFPIALESCWQAVEECVKQKGKILWIRNRVDWANETYQECRDRFADSADALVYHSRFKYKDRSRRHRRVIDAFRSKGNATILVSTQVAEMSLDLSADLLITDIAAVPALIQRMGRLNRNSLPGNPLPTKKALVMDLAVDQSLPYSNQDVEDSRKWVMSLMAKGTDLSQRDLAMEFATIAPQNGFNMEAAEKRAIFFSGLWETRPGQTREEGYTINILLQSDVQHLRQKGIQPSKDWIREHEVSVPFKDQVMSWEKLTYLPVAPASAIRYDFNETTQEGTGATWLL